MARVFKQTGQPRWAHCHRLVSYLGSQRLIRNFFSYHLRSQLVTTAEASLLSYFIWNSLRVECWVLLGQPTELSCFITSMQD